MPVNKGKSFELQFKKDWLKMSRAVCERLPDIMSGYKSISGICDFICYKYPKIYFIECKVIEKGNTFELSRLSQYDKLIAYDGVKGVVAGTVLWYVEKNKVLFVPIHTYKLLKQDDKKSFNIKYLDTKEYEAIDLPSTLKRTFMETDYSLLTKEDDDAD